MTTQGKKVWFITGSSTGFGRLLAEKLLKNGEIVAATARKPEQLADLTEQYLSQVIALPLDVTKPEQVRDAVNRTISTFGRIDVLVYNAGYGMMGAIEEVTDAEGRKQYETNVFVRLMNRVHSAQTSMAVHCQQQRISLMTTTQQSVVFVNGSEMWMERSQEILLKQ